MKKNEEFNPAEVGPTLTLAQLYESQNQYYDALAIYEKLYSQRKDPQILERLERVRKRLLGEMSAIHDQLMEVIFTLAEMEKFRIIPEEKFKRYVESIAQDKKKEEERIALEDQIDSVEESSQNPHSEISLSDGITLEDGGEEAVGVNWLELSTGDFLRRMESVVGRDRKLSSLTLGEILRILH